MKKVTLIANIQGFSNDLFGPLTSDEQFNVNSTKDFAGNETVIGIDKGSINYELNDGEAMDTELDNLTKSDLQEILKILHSRKRKVS